LKNFFKKKLCDKIQKNPSIRTKEAVTAKKFKKFFPLNTQERFKGDKRDIRGYGEKGDY
jgi:hypothetical protein